MGKRLNPHRRLLARQAALRKDAAMYANAPDAGKLQEGRVRSSLNPRVQHTAHHGPHFVPLAPMPSNGSGKGKVGRIIV